MARQLRWMVIGGSSWMVRGVSMPKVDARRKATMQNSNILPMPSEGMFPPVMCNQDGVRAAVWSAAICLWLAIVLTLPEKSSLQPVPFLRAFDWAILVVVSC